MWTEQMAVVGGSILGVLLLPLRISGKLQTLLNNEPKVMVFLSASNLPTPSLPFPNTHLTYIPPTSSSTHRVGQTKADIIGESVGASIAVLLPISVVSCYLWRRKRRKMKEMLEMSLKWDDEDRGIKSTPVRWGGDLCINFICCLRFLIYRGRTRIGYRRDTDAAAR